MDTNPTLIELGVRYLLGSNLKDCRRFKDTKIRPLALSGEHAPRRPRGGICQWSLHNLSHFSSLEVLHFLTINFAFESLFCL